MKMYDYPRNSMSRGTKIRGSQHPERDSSSSAQIRTQQQQSTLPIAILWDMENCMVPSEVKPDEVAGNVRNALRHNSGIQGAVTFFSAYGDFTHISTKVRQGCQRTGVNLIDVPNGKKDASDKAILVDLFLYALDNRPPCTIVLISGDVDFAPALHKLGQRGYTVALAIPSNVGVSSALCSAGQFVWDWPSMARGAGLVPAKNNTNFNKIITNVGDRPHEIPSSRGGIAADGRAPEVPPWGGGDERVAEVMDFSGLGGPPKSVASPSDDSDLNNGDETAAGEENIVWRIPQRFTDMAVHMSVVPGSKLESQRQNLGGGVASRSAAQGKRFQDVNAVVARDLGKLTHVARAMSPAVRRPQQETVGSSSSTGVRDAASQAANLQVLKEQTLELIGYNGPRLELSRVAAEFQRQFGKPLADDGNNGAKLMDILEKSKDWIYTRGEGASTTVHLTRIGSRAYGKLKRDAKGRNVAIEDAAVSDAGKVHVEDLIDMSDAPTGDEAGIVDRAPSIMPALLELQALDVRSFPKEAVHHEPDKNQASAYDWELGSGGSVDENNDVDEERDLEVDDSTLEEVVMLGKKRGLGVLDTFKMELQELLISHAWHIGIPAFRRVYERRYSRPLDFSKFGVEDLESLIKRVGDVATIRELAGVKEVVGLGWCTW